MYAIICIPLPCRPDKVKRLKVTVRQSIHDKPQSAETNSTTGPVIKHEPTTLDLNTEAHSSAETGKAKTIAMVTPNSQHNIKKETTTQAAATSGSYMSTHSPTIDWNINVRSNTPNAAMRSCTTLPTPTSSSANLTATISSSDKNSAVLVQQRFEDYKRDVHKLLQCLISKGKLQVPFTMYSGEEEESMHKLKAHFCI